jgi:predicted histone-like DNA-binding protein
MKYKLIQRVNPVKREEKKWYANPVNDGKVNENELAKEISALSSLSRGDVSNVIANMIDAIPKYLLMGKSVSLGELGTLRLSLSSKGVEKPEEFHVGMIGKVKVIFTPSVSLKDEIKKVKFEKETK